MSENFVTFDYYDSSTNLSKKYTLIVEVIIIGMYLLLQSKINYVKARRKFFIFFLSENKKKVT